jgi:hypothetical protein
MNRQQIGRRIVLGAMTVVLAVPGLGAAAEPYAEGSTSGAGFEGYCEDGGGTFTDTEDGNLWCQWGDDSQTVCDTDGQDCYDIPYIPPASDPRTPTGGLGIEPTTNGDGAAAPVGTGGGVTSPLLGIDRASLPEAVPHLAAPAPDRNQDQPASKHGKHGKKHGHRGKHHKQ